MSRDSTDNYVIFKEDTVVKYSPKSYIDFSIEMEHAVIQHLNKLNITHIPSIIKYNFNPKTCESSLEMTKINGTLLFDVLKYSMPANKAVYLLLNILYALQEIHQCNVSHGDIHGDNIIIIPTKTTFNFWKDKDSIIGIQSFGMKPIFIDFGFAHCQEIIFKPDLSTSYVGSITSMVPNFRGDIIELFKTALGNEVLNPIVKIPLQQLASLSSFRFLPIDETITTYFRSYRYSKKYLYKFFTGELYNIIRCFPSVSLSTKEELNRNTNWFLKFLTVHGMGKTRQELFRNLKIWHLKKYATKGMKAGASVINFLIQKNLPAALIQVETYAGNFPFHTAKEAIQYLEKH